MSKLKVQFDVNYDENEYTTQASKDAMQRAIDEAAAAAREAFYDKMDRLQLVMPSYALGAH